MGDNRKSKTAFSSRCVTLNSLKDEMHSLNMRLLLAIQNHDREAQEEINRQITSIQDEIDHISAVGGHRNFK